MSADHTIPDDRAVIDRVVDGAMAVLLIGPDEVELQLPADQLPDGAGEAVWVKLDLGTDPPTILAVDRELTERRAAAIESQLARIRARQSGGRFNRP